MGLNVKKKELKNMIKHADTDGDSKIGYEEFKALVARGVNYFVVIFLVETFILFIRCVPPVNDALYGDSELKAAFDAFDESKDGFICKTELKCLMDSLGGDFTDNDIKEMLEDADLDNDGKVSFEEYKAIMSG